MTVLAVTRQELKIYREVLECTDCGKGQLVYTGTHAFGDCNDFVHKCNSCGAIRSVKNAQFPRVIQELVDGKDKYDG